MVAGVVNPIVGGVVVTGIPSRWTVAVLSARISSGDGSSRPHCSQQSSYEYVPAGQSVVRVFVQPVFAEIHCVPDNVNQEPFGAMTVAGPGEEKPVVPDGAAISDQIGSLPPITACPVEMSTDTLGPHVGVAVALGVAVKVAVGVRVGVAVRLSVGVRVGEIVAVRVNVGVGDLSGVLLCVGVAVQIAPGQPTVVVGVGVSVARGWPGTHSQPESSGLGTHTSVGFGQVPPHILGPMKSHPPCGEAVGVAVGVRAGTVGVLHLPPAPATPAISPGLRTRSKTSISASANS